MSKTTLAQGESTKEALANTLLSVKCLDLRPGNGLLLRPYFYPHQSEYTHSSPPGDDSEKEAIQGLAQGWLDLDPVPGK